MDAKNKNKNKNKNKQNQPQGMHIAKCIFFDTLQS
jgi:hypothetical protein